MNTAPAVGQEPSDPGEPEPEQRRPVPLRDLRRGSALQHGGPEQEIERYLYVQC